MHELLIRKVLKLTIEDANEMINASVYMYEHNMEDYDSHAAYGYYCV